MSKISIAIENRQQGMKPASPQVQFIKNVGGLSIDEAIICLEQGTSHPFYKAELFLNDHLDRDEEIRFILEGMKSQNLKPFILERSYDEDWDSDVDIEIAHISEDILLNILNGSKGDFQ